VHASFPSEPLVYHAIRSSNCESAVALLRRINGVGIDDFPLVSLFQYGTVGTAKWVVGRLLEQGEKLFSGALHAAAKRERDGPALVAILLDAGVDVNAKSPSINMASFDKDMIILGPSAFPSGETALMAACSEGTWETVDVLLRRGARRGLEDDYRKTAKDKAGKAGRKDIVELLENYTRAKSS
jgi:ankyrin repeat protein